MTSTTRNIAVAAIALIGLAVTAGDAAAWSCRAKSRIADGWGYSPILQTARQEARLQCMLHTPRRMSCRVVGCWR